MIQQQGNQQGNFKLLFFLINGGIYVLLRLKNGIEISGAALNKPDGLNVFRSVYAQTFLIGWGDLRFFSVQGDQHVI